MYRFVASDMDETFLGHDHLIPEANVRALERMREIGVLFVPSSGRPYGSVMQSLEPVRGLLEGSYVIALNGATINRVGEDEPLVARGMDFSRMRALFEYGLGVPEVGFHVYDLAGNLWTWRLGDYERDHLAAANVARHAMGAPSIDFLADVPVSKIIFCNRDMATLRRVASQVPAELLGGVEITFSSGRYLEFMPDGVNKGLGIRNLAELLGCSTDDAIACGDAANDTTMLEAAGVGVAVANAIDGLAGVADYVAASTCDDGVLAEVLRELILPPGRPREVAPAPHDGLAN